MQLTSAPIVVSRHALERITERGGQPASFSRVRSILNDHGARLDHASGAWLYAGAGFVLVVRHVRGRRVVVTALSPEMVAQDLVEGCMQEVEQRRGRRSQNWRNDVIKTASWCSQVRRRVGQRLVAPATDNAAPSPSPVIPQHVADELAAFERQIFERELAESPAETSVIKIAA